MMFFNFFDFFVIFFGNFLTRVEYERKSRLKLFSLFLDQSHPDLVRNNAGMTFFIVLKFFAIFYGNF